MKTSSKDVLKRSIIIFSVLSTVIFFSVYVYFYRNDQSRIPASVNCSEIVQSALSAAFPTVNMDDVMVQTILKFDCEESTKITSIDLPYNDVVAKFDEVTKKLSKVGNFAEEFRSIILPYCRQGNPWFGSFCMGMDIYSAKVIGESPELLEKLPDSILAINKELYAKDLDEPVDFVEVLESVFPGSDPDTIRNRVLMASFIGLDDNGVQTSRLMANLLFQERYDEYVRLFPVLSQVGEVFKGATNKDYSNKFLEVMYATRIGRGRSSNLAQTSKSYKAWAMTFFGCLEAKKYAFKPLLSATAFLMGYGYEMTKVAGSFHKGCLTLLSSLVTHHKGGVKVGKMMNDGLSYGYNLCK